MNRESGNQAAGDEQAGRAEAQGVGAAYQSKVCIIDLKRQRTGALQKLTLARLPTCDEPCPLFCPLCPLAALVLNGGRNIRNCCLVDGKADSQR